MKNLSLAILLSFLTLVPSFSQFDIGVAEDLNPEHFNPDFSNYDRETAIYCAQLSNVVYESESSITSYLEALNLIYPEANYKMAFFEDRVNSTELMFFGR